MHGRLFNSILAVMTTVLQLALFVGAMWIVVLFLRGKPLPVIERPRSIRYPFSCVRFGTAVVLSGVIVYQMVYKLFDGLVTTDAPFIIAVVAVSGAFAGLEYYINTRKRQAPKSPLRLLLYWLLLLAVNGYIAFATLLWTAAE